MVKPALAGCCNRFLKKLEGTVIFAIIEMDAAKLQKGEAGTYLEAPFLLCDFDFHASRKIMMFLPSL